MPNAPKTPVKGFRIPEDLYDEAQRCAAAAGVALSDVVRACLERYVRRQRRAEARNGDADSGGE